MSVAHETALLPTQRPLTLPELEQVLDGVGTPTAARVLSGGTFSAVQAVDLADGTTVVAKTSVPHAVLADGRTPLLTYELDMLHSERDILQLVEDLPDVPAPRVLHSDFSREVAEVDVVIMDMIPGTPWNTVIDTMTPEANARAGESVGRILAGLKAVTGERFGYPAQDFTLGATDWPTFFTRLMETAVADAVAWGVDIEADRVMAAVARGQDALAEVTTPYLIHNDLWHGNVLLDPASGHVFGVVDFERALFADPLWDFVGAESMQTGPTTPALLRGYEQAGQTLPWDPHAGTATGFTTTADIRTTLYRLWTLSVQYVEIVPRQFTGEWVEGHRQKIRGLRSALLERAGV